MKNHKTQQNQNITAEARRRRKKTETRMKETTANTDETAMREEELDQRPKMKGPADSRISSRHRIRQRSRVSAYLQSRGPMNRNLRVIRLKPVPMRAVPMRASAQLTLPEDKRGQTQTIGREGGQREHVRPQHPRPGIR